MERRTAKSCFDAGALFDVSSYIGATVEAPTDSGNENNRIMSNCTEKINKKSYLLTIMSINVIIVKIIFSRRYI